MHPFEFKFSDSKAPLPYYDGTIILQDKATVLSLTHVLCHKIISTNSFSVTIQGYHTLGLTFPRKQVEDQVLLTTCPIHLPHLSSDTPRYF